jgi:hypothetical protein
MLILLWVLNKTIKVHQNMAIIVTYNRATTRESAGAGGAESEARRETGLCKHHLPTSSKTIRMLFFS